MYYYCVILKDFDWLTIIQSSVVTWWIVHCTICLLFRSHICQYHPITRLQLETRKEGGDCHRFVVYLPPKWQCQELKKGRWPSSNARIIPRRSNTKMFQARDVVWNHIKNINERCSSMESILKQILPKSNFSNAYLTAPSYLYIHRWLQKRNFMNNIQYICQRP